MKFTIIMARNKEDGGGHYALNLPQEDCGLEFADKLRKDTGRLDLDIEKIHPIIEYRQERDYSIIISEEQARECGKFATQTTHRVQVAYNQLNDFANVEYYAKNNESSGAVESAGAKWTLDEDAIYQFWKESGFPDVLPQLDEDEDQGVIQ